MTKSHKLLVSLVAAALLAWMSAAAFAASLWADFAPTVPPGVTAMFVVNGSGGHITQVTVANPANCLLVYDWAQVDATTAHVWIANSCGQIETGDATLWAD